MIEQTLEESRRLEDLNELLELGVMDGPELVEELLGLALVQPEGRAWTAEGNSLTRVEVVPWEEPFEESGRPSSERLRLELRARRLGFDRDWRYAYIMTRVKADRFALIELRLALESFGSAIAKDLAERNAPLASIDAR